MDELNHDFQALALEGRAMGEVSELVCQKSGLFLREDWSCLSSDVSKSSLQKYVLAFPCCHSHDRDRMLENFAKTMSLKEEC